MKNDNVKFKIIYSVIAIALIAGLCFYFFNNNEQDKNKKANEEANRIGVWEVMVVIRDQNLSDDPVEDAKIALKRGDVISVRPEGHIWAETEYYSYLLLKINAKKSAADALLLPLEKETGEKDKEGNKIKETIRARKFAIDLEKIGFAGDQVINGQPFEGEVFGEEVIVEK